MNIQTPRIRESEMDHCIEKLLIGNGPSAYRFIAAVLPEGLQAPVTRIARQTHHHGASGTVDLDVYLANGVRLLCENKIDAGWSVTSCGTPQPERYRRSVAKLNEDGVSVWSVLVAPESYLDTSRHNSLFDAVVSYETLAAGLVGSDGDLLRDAIRQSEGPYEPVPNVSCARFHAAYHDLVEREFPHLVLKKNPNGKGVRPTGSRTIYFDVPRMLKNHAGIPKPRLSVQSRDTGAGHPSAKLMIGGWGFIAGAATAPKSLERIGAYLRPAGRSLGIVVDTPAMQVLAPLDGQLDAARAGLAAVEELVRWWNAEGTVMDAWNQEVRSQI